MKPAALFFSLSLVLALTAMAADPSTPASKQCTDACLPKAFKTATKEDQKPMLSLKAASPASVACKLGGAEKEARLHAIRQEIVAGVTRATELPDGFELHFPGSAEWPEKLARFISLERECCPFFRFEIAFAPDMGPIALRIRGPEGTKDLLRPLLKP